MRTRLARIMPAFWVCLVVTAFIFAPLSMAVDGISPIGILQGPSWQYLYKNVTLIIFQHGIAGTPLNVPYPGDWNASLWTLKWEMLCYLGVLLLGVMRVFRLRALHMVAAGCFVALAVACSVADLPHIATDIARFGLMYEVGVLLFLCADRVPLTWMGVGIAAASVVGSAYLLPDYRILGAPGLGYALVGIGLLFRHQRFQFKNDISYGVYIYGFPVEQVLVKFDWLAGLPFLVFALVAVLVTVPIAVASWVVIEKPVMRSIKLRAATARVEGDSVGGTTSVSSLLSEP